MDYSTFRRSGNVEDMRQDPWSPLYKAYAYTGAEFTPSEVIKDMVEALSHPLERSSRMTSQYLPAPAAPPGSLADQAGANSFGPMNVLGWLSGKLE